MHWQDISKRKSKMQCQSSIRVHHSEAETERRGQNACSDEVA